MKTITHGKIEEVRKISVTGGKKVFISLGKGVSFEGEEEEVYELAKALTHACKGSKVVKLV